MMNGFNLHFLHFSFMKTMSMLQLAHAGKRQKQFDMYFATLDVKDGTHKRALLPYSNGEEVSDIFKTLPEQGEEKVCKKMIFNNPTCKATARLERLQLRLHPYKTNIVYKPGADNPADYMSLHPESKKNCKLPIIYQELIICQLW